jgi:hypothetical protein
MYDVGHYVIREVPVVSSPEELVGVNAVVFSTWQRHHSPPLSLPRKSYAQEARIVGNGSVFDWLVAGMKSYAGIREAKGTKRKSVRA